MTRTNSSPWRAAFLTLAAATALSCSDVGDSLAPGGGNAPGAGADATTTSDATVGSDSPGGDTLGTSDDASGNPNAATDDTGSPAAEATESGAQDAGAPETSGEAASPDATVDDSAADAQDAGAAETGGSDAAPDVVDAAPDVLDAGPEPVDAAPDVIDAGPEPVDAAPDVIDAGAALRPCTTAGQTHCVQCQGNTSGLCTPTEAAIVALDIAKNGITAGPDGDGMGAGATSCYACLFNGGCIDDTQYSTDVNHECEDSLATFGTAAQCEATLACILSTNCANAAVAICYCGTASIAGTCQGNPAPGPINGACDAVIAAGLGFAVTDGTDNTAKLENTGYASGKADKIFQCSLANHCSAVCQP